MPERPQINFRIPQEEKEKLEMWAIDEGRSISNLICRILKHAIDERVKGDTK